MSGEIGGKKEETNNRKREKKEEERRSVETNCIIIMIVPTMDKLPRVPDAHGDVVDEKTFSDLYIRTSWVDANVALDQINKVRTHRPNSIIFFTTHLSTLDQEERKCVTGLKSKFYF